MLVFVIRTIYCVVFRIAYVEIQVLIQNKHAKYFYNITAKHIIYNVKKWV